AENEIRHLSGKRFLEIRREGAGFGAQVMLVAAGAEVATVGITASFSAVSVNHDAVVVKNQLKRGYIHPTDHTPPETKIQLSLSDGEYLLGLFNLLRPGGRLLVYNLCPAPSSGYNPHADCRNPFPQSAWQAAGFRVRDYDRNDTVV